MAGESYRFGPFLIDRAGYRALRGAEPVDLTPQLLDLLLHLLDHAGTLVTKEQLLDALWPGANVTENALTQAVSELRDALGDDAGAPRFIKTVARRGYRFIAPVEAVGSPLPAGGEPAQPVSICETDAIAVMDFVNVTGDPESAWLSAGIAETVTGDLRALDHFRVVDRGRVIEAVRGTDGSLQQVVNALGVPLAVVGSYQRNGRRVRITARVVNVASGEALADAKVDGPLDGIFDLQDQVVAQFSKELGVPGGRPGARDTPCLEAFRAFTEGSLRLETLDVREMSQAIVDFERAVATDPRYALAHAGLASAELALYETTRPPRRLHRTFELASPVPPGARHLGRSTPARRLEHARAVPGFRVRAFSDRDGPRRPGSFAGSRNGAPPGSRRAGSSDRPGGPVSGARPALDARARAAGARRCR
jgi:DNA-binding winged helix-turn-helix (wHTH) protein